MTDEADALRPYPAGSLVPGTEKSPEPEEVSLRLRWWQIFWGMICRPGRTFRITQGRSGLLVPALMVLGGTTFTTLLISVARREEMTALMHEELASSGLPPVEIENIVSMATSPLALAFGVAGGLATILFTWIAQSGIMHLAVKALGGKGAFRQAFEIAGWAWVALFIGSLVKSGYILLTGNLDLPQGAGLGHAFLANTDLFVVWNMALLVLGFATVYGVQKWKVAIPVVALWLITVFLAYIFTLLAQVPGLGT